jgi:tetratricopeptide (TPR) repeat protein
MSGILPPSRECARSELRLPIILVAWLSVRYKALVTPVRLPDALLVPDHDLIERIGRGGYGEVWLARNRTTRTLRAVKIVFRDEFEDERPYQREFEGLLKFEPISRSHPSQLAILHVGRNDGAGCFYYVMELADPEEMKNEEGRMQNSSEAQSASAVSSFGLLPSYFPKTLRSEIKSRGRLPAAKVIELGRALSTALAHLHSHSLVHRDIKPANIVYVGGVPKLADIGLVTDASDNCSIVGTEGYIPPEGPGSPQADLYSLGKVLYEGATGRDRRDYPALPDDLRSWPDANVVTELNAIILRACASDTRKRYQSSDRMRADLEILSAGRSVKLRRTIALVSVALKKAALSASLLGVLVTLLVLAKFGHTKSLDPLTTGKNVGGYPPTAMRGTTNVEAWKHYRLGRFAGQRFSPEGLPEGTVTAEHEFREAIRLDPKFALAYGELFMARFGDPGLLTHAKAPDEFRALAAKMVELDNGLAETHHVLGFIRFWEWKWAEAEREFREALRLNPNCIPAYISYGFYLSHMGRTRESIQVLESARQQVDPTNPQIVKMTGHAYFVDRDFTNAVAYYREASRLVPSFADGHFRAALACFALNDYRTAIDELETNEVKSGKVDPAQTKQRFKELRDALDKSGPDGYWRKRLEEVTAKVDPEDRPYAFATIYAHLGDKTQAFKYLDKAYERHDQLIYLIFDEFWDPWREEPRFKEVITKVGLAQLERDWLHRLAARRSAQPQPDLTAADRHKKHKKEGEQ